ncbi:MAG: hypothetical protein JXQ75_23405 [Phycisphaerae bacterium]|nr:hypothetical protein [Phycisphaerae bacterium]
MVPTKNRTRTHSRFVLVASVIAMLPAIQAAGQSVMIKPKFKPGQTCYIERTGDVKQEIPGGQIAEHTTVLVDARQIMGMIQEVQSVKDGETHLQLTFDRRAFVGKTARVGPISYDTDLKDEAQNSAVAALFRPMMGTTVTLVLDKDYAAKSFSGMAAIVEKVEKDAAGNELWGMFMPGMTDEGYKSTWGHSRYVIYPNKEVKVGETWEKSYLQPDPQLGDLHYAYKVKLDSVSEKEGRRQASVSYQATVTKIGEPKEREGAGFSFGFQSGQISGTATFDVELGQFVEQVQDASLKIEAKMSGGQPSIMNLEMTTKDRVAVSSIKEREEQKRRRSQETTSKPQPPRQEVEEKAEQKTEEKPREKPQQGDTPS